MAKDRKAAPTLYGIIAFKLGKGLFFLSLALGIYSLLDNNLPGDFKEVLAQLHLDPEKQFWSQLAGWLAKITPKNIVWAASGTFLYGLISLTESVGLMFRQAWAGWLTIAEGAFFIPIEVYELGAHASIGLTVLLILNVLIVFYLYRNRDRLFHHKLAKAPEGASKPK
jgi:uncharacterized membrane protein (DUF2068 family)